MHLPSPSSSSQQCNEHISLPWKINTPIKSGSGNPCSSDYGPFPIPSLLLSYSFPIPSLFPSLPSFPVLHLNCLHLLVMFPKTDNRILFVIINSVYSFWWDVVMDWNLTLLTNPSAPGTKLWGLRKTIHFSSPQLYYTAIALDFILRYTPSPPRAGAPAPAFISHLISLSLTPSPSLPFLSSSI
jgi:EXS family